MLLVPLHSPILFCLSLAHGPLLLFWEADHALYVALGLFESLHKRSLLMKGGRI